MKRSDIPNIISVLRIGMVLPITLALLNEQFQLALLLFAVAGISDGLDGYLAKHYHWQSRLGSILDPLADKILLVFTYIALAWLGLLPLWLVVAVIARDALIVSGGLAFHYLIGQYEMAPSLVSKLNTVAQIVLAFLVVLSAAANFIPESMIDWMIIVVTATTLISGLDYLWTWGSRAIQSRGHKTMINGDK